jgi:hypothetical protein
MPYKWGFYSSEIYFLGRGLCFEPLKIMEALPLSLYGIPTDGVPSQGHSVNPLHDRGDTALRLRGPQSHYPCGFPGLPALGGPPMSGVVSSDQSKGW